MAQDFSKRFYASQEWMDFRFNLILERGPVCQRCGRLVTDTSKLIGHHRITLAPQNINDPSFTLNKDYVELICFECHNREHKRYGYNQHNVYIVYGSPMSGKNTLVNQLAEYGDMILDIDRIFECISGMPLYIKPDNLRFNVFALRDKMLDMIKTRYGGWHDAYIIGGYPNKAERERLASELGAELIYCACTKEECYARAMQVQDIKQDWTKWIDKWWNEYTA